MKKIAPVLLLLCTSCNVDTQLLSGTWKAVSFYQNGKTVQVPLDSVELSFAENGQYSFRSVGFYKEEGPYRASGKYLFLTDMTAKPPREHTLSVLFLSNDSLKIGMKKDTSEQVLFFQRVVSGKW
ncbi:MAG: hypothetical protein IPK76_24080 [Lewinellaceae bacterium]|jgi:hypothetical protein|nr:hypothetical protein [Lewinellaceae bacterium]